MNDKYIPYNKELAERITKDGQEILSNLPGLGGIKNYKLLGWNMLTVDLQSVYWHPDDCPIDFPLIVKSAGNDIETNWLGLDTVLVDIGEERQEFSLYWFLWEPLESTPDRGVV